MATTTSDIRNGLVITWNGDLWQIVEFMHVKPGKGGAFVRTKLKNVRNGKVVDNTFRAGERIETARVERRQMQFLYASGDEYNPGHGPAPARARARHHASTLPRPVPPSRDR